MVGVLARRAHHLDQRRRASTPPSIARSPSSRDAREAIARARRGARRLEGGAELDEARAPRNMRRGTPWCDKATKPTNTNVPSYAQVVGAVNRVADDTDLALTAAGGFPGELCKNWRVKTPGTFDCEFGFSCMGYEIAGAWGAKMADESRDVLCFIGDGSYLMMNSDIYSTVLTGHKLIVVLCDNGGFAVINRLQNFKGVPSFNNQIEDCKIVNKVDVDFAAHAASMGALYAHGRKPDRPRRRGALGEDERPHDRPRGEDGRLHLDAGRRLVGRRRAGGVHARGGQEGARRTTPKGGRSSGSACSRSHVHPDAEPPSKNSVAGEDRCERLARRQLGAHGVLRARLLQRQLDRLPCQRSGMTITPSTSPKIQSPGDHRYAAALDRHVDRLHLAAPLAVERSDGAGEDRKAHLADRGARREPARRSRSPRHDARATAVVEQLAPWRDPVLARAGHHRDVVGIEAVDQRDLELVGIVAGLARGRPARRARCARDRTGRAYRRADGSSGAAPVPVAERIEDIRDDAGIELGSAPPRSMLHPSSALPSRFPA